MSSTSADMSAAGQFALSFVGNEWDVAREYVVFFFCLGAVQDAKRSRNRMHQVAQVIFRTLGYPGIGMLLPLLLGQMHGDVFNNGRINFDTFLYILGGAIAFNELFIQNMPSVVRQVFKYIINFFQCLVIANSVGLGFEAASAAITGSMFVGVVGGFLAANSFNILNVGLSYFQGRKYSNESFIGFFGALLYLFLTQYVMLSALASRVVLVVIRLGQEYINFNAILDYVANAFDAHRWLPFSAMKRSVSRSASMKKRR